MSSPLWPHPPVSATSHTNPPQNLCAEASPQKVNMYEAANKVHIFSHNLEEAWEGYDSTLIESESDSNSRSKAVPPDEPSLLTAAAVKAAGQEQVHQSFHWVDIKEHECTLKAKALVDPPSQMTSLSASLVANVPASKAPGQCHWVDVECCVLETVPPCTC
jgi:hypothetical protein